MRILNLFLILSFAALAMDAPERTDQTPLFTQEDILSDEEKKRRIDAFFKKAQELGINNLKRKEIWKGKIDLERKISQD